MKQIHVSIITPSGEFMNEDVDIITVKTTEGYIGLQAGHTPFAASIDISEMTVNFQGSKNRKEIAIGGGLLVSDPNNVQIITDDVVFKEEIDVAKEEKALKLYKLKINAQKDLLEISKLENLMKQSLNKINIKKS